jgi:glycosyltransferase involved in cell wall biosynthesis
MISLIIPTLRVGNMLNECIDSFKGQYDELIVVDDKDKSLAYKQNKGMRLSRGDHLIVCNDDVLSNRGELKDLCREEVTCPLVNGGVFKVFHGHMFCMPREIFAITGGFDESYEGVYYIDSELWYRLKMMNYPPITIEQVDIFHHHPASTIKTLSSKEKNEHEGKNWFISKWGEQALGEVGC